MGELDEPVDKNIRKIEAKIINLSFNGLAYNTRKDFAYC